MSVLDDFLTHHESGHFRFRTAYTTSRAAPTDLLVIWNLSGEMDVQIAEEDHRVGAGELVVLPPGVAHRYRAAAEHGWEWLWLHVGGRAVAELTQRLTAGGPVLALGNDVEIRSRFVELVDAAAAGPEPRAPAERLHLDSCAFSLLGLVLRRTAPLEGGRSAPGGSLSHVTTWVRDHLDRAVTLQDLTHASGWSTAQLSRLMRRQLGSSPMQYVTRIRMREASRLLTDSDLTVSEIARRVGFADPLHFSRRFRQVTGVSPRVWRGHRATTPKAR